jgi:hypothetical protein
MKVYVSTAFKLQLNWSLQLDCRNAVRLSKAFDVQSTAHQTIHFGLWSNFKGRTLILTAYLA